MSDVFTAIPASGSTNGEPIKITSTTAATAQTIHTALLTGEDKVWLYAHCNGADTVTHTLYILYGGSTIPDHQIPVTVYPGETPRIVIPGFPLKGGATVKAFCDTANAVSVVFSATRRTPS